VPAKNLVHVSVVELVALDKLTCDAARADVCLAVLRGVVRSRVALRLEVLALCHQLQVLQRSRPRRVRLANADRWLWAWLSRSWSGWRTALVIVKPETVIAWHRQGFRVFWTWKSRRCIGRSPVAADVRALIRRMAQENPLWGAPRIHGELLKLGLEVSQSRSRNICPAGPLHRRKPGARSSPRSEKRAHRAQDRVGRTRPDPMRGAARRRAQVLLPRRRVATIGQVFAHDGVAIVPTALVMAVVFFRKPPATPRAGCCA